MGVKETFVLKDIASWKGEILGLLGDIIDDAVMLGCKSIAVQDMVCDDMGWLEKVILEVKGTRVDMISLLAHRLQKRYATLRGFHGCCARNLSSYYDMGLIPLDYELMLGIAQHHFLSGRFPEITKSLLEKAIKAMIENSPLRQRRVYFALDDQELINDCGHYLLYGSEFLAGLASELGGLTGRRDYYVHKLKGSGRPTVFVCDVPCELIPDYLIGKLCEMILKDLFRSVVKPDFEQGQVDGGFWIHERLSPDYIVSHYHPEKIRNPFTFKFETIDV